jgi:hypothetical protein
MLRCVVPDTERFIRFIFIILSAVTPARIGLGQRSNMISMADGEIKWAGETGSLVVRLLSAYSWRYSTAAPPRH